LFKHRYAFYLAGIHEKRRFEAPFFMRHSGGINATPPAPLQVLCPTL
jgi:hypothetical protein